MSNVLWHAKPTAGHDVHGQSAVYDEESGKDVAIVYDGKAHADLIAAAPETTDCLKWIVAYVAEHSDTFFPDGDQSGDHSEGEWFETASAAIAKAEGGA